MPFNTIFTLYGPDPGTLNDVFLEGLGLNGLSSGYVSAPSVQGVHYPMLPCIFTLYIRILNT